jgi:hypothetical protein
MANKISAVRAYLSSDAQDKPLASPLAIDLAHEIVPYGARVRVEAEIEVTEPICTPWMYVFNQDLSGRLPLYRLPRGNTYRAEGRWPFDFFGGEFSGQTSPPRFPNAAWPSNFSEDFFFQIGVQPTDRPATETDTLLASRLHLAAPKKGGSPPKITRLEGLPADALRLGQPWLAKATVGDADNDVAAVVFSVFRAGKVAWSLMRDDGRFGDEHPGDGVYSFLRVAGDWWDHADYGKLASQEAVFTAQAVDLCGNWSEPVSLKYELLFDEEPLWAAESSSDAPNILEVSISREGGVPGCPLVRARCDSSDAYVCARVVVQQNYINPLFDDGLGPDAVAGDGIYSDLIGLPHSGFWDVVCYAVPKSGPFRMGKRMAAVSPPLGKCTGAE